MGQTRYFGLAFFDFGDQLDSRINVQKEIDRFVIIDKQLYGLYKVFGNGVISGWTVQDAGYQESQGISISISQGVGVINYIASETSLPGFIYGLPVNSLIDIYATLSGTTSINRSINFVYSTVPLNSKNVIRIARVSTGSNSVLYIDNTVRDLIGFEEIIQSAINEHKHRGTPSKIDLQSEVKNQLPGARLEGIDASKVVSGQFDIDRIPLVDHNELENNGLLTHAALDSFVKTLSQNNKELLGEIASVNLLKSILFWKYKYADVDEHFLNEIALIPGISPDNFIDFDASSANINLSTHCISGVPSKSGIFTSVYWNSSYSFNTAYYKNNMIIEDDTMSLNRSDQSEEIIANFSDGLIGFESETLVIDDDTSAVVINDSANRVGRLTSGSTENYFFRKNFSYPSMAKNWDGIYDELVIKVKTIDQIHEPVYIYVVNGSNLSSDTSKVFGSIESGDIDGVKKPSASWELLEQDEYMSEFQEKVFDISSLELTDVSQITIYTSDKNLSFDIDDISVRRTNLVSSSGTARFRYSTEANVVFHSIFYDAITPQDTSISFRVHTASSEDGLLRSSYSLPLNSGDVIALNGTNSEIEVVMTSNSERTLSPILNSLELRILVNADFTGFVIDTEAEWERGTLKNVSTNDSVEEGKSYLTVSTPINVDGRYFAKSSSVSEINDNNIGVYGFSGNLMPVSPNQARLWNGSSSRGFDVVSSVVRTFENHFIISDLNNNRVVEVDSEGNLVKGFGSTYSIDTDFYPLSAIYNNTNNILTIVFTKSAVVSDISKIYFYFGSSKIYLSSSDTVLSTTKAGNKILEIELDVDTAIRLTDANSNNLFINFAAGAFTNNIITKPGMSVSGNAIYSSLRGLTCFVGDFTYIDNISHPIYAGVTSDNNWVIANSSIHFIKLDADVAEAANVPDVIEIDPLDVTDIDNKLISSDIKFSDYSLGGIYEWQDGSFIIAGIEESISSVSTVTGDDIRNQYDTVPDNVEFRASAVDDLKNYNGIVVVIDKSNNKRQVLYSSPDGLYPSDVDGFNDGSMIVSESSFYDTSGRLVKIDTYGNVVWQYGSGTFNIINDTKVLRDGSLIVSV